MFFHNFKYSLKYLIKNKMLIFWTFAFPIILGGLFHFAFLDIEKNEKLDIIDIAVVEGDEFKNYKVLMETIKSLSSKSNSSRLFSTKYVSEDEAKELLDDKKIAGYICVNGKDAKVVVKENGIEATIIKYVVDEVRNFEIMFNNIMEEELRGTGYLDNTVLVDFQEKIIREVKEKSEKSYLREITDSNLSYTMVEFYTLLAMSQLYGGILAMVVINGSLANISTKGRRVSVAPIKKGTIILSGLLASYIVQIIGVAILLAFLYFILNINFGSNLPLVVLLSLVGSLAGLSMGILVASIFKCRENTKTGIMIAITMFGCFLSGMMGITMKYVIDKNIPLINKFNPANMITDGFYALYYYDTLERYWFNIGSLLVFSIILILISYRVLRRQTYDYI